jgi:deoxyribodipyrimidine photolyase-related protein
MKILRLILWDHLSKSISALHDCNKDDDVVLMCEVHKEATYVKHHKKKLVFLLSCMRHFAEELREDGYFVEYVKLLDRHNTGSLQGEVERAIRKYKIEKVVVTHPGEWRILQDIQNWEQLFGIPVEIREDQRFLCSVHEFSEWADNREQLRMEFFYRMMRKKHHILMDGDNPAGGLWNYDKENRKPPKKGMQIPAPYVQKPDAITQEVMELVQQQFPDHFGDLTPFHFAVTRKQAKQVLAHFIKERLCLFGDFQYAMLQGEPWMYHSHLSFYMNCGLLLAEECIQAAYESYQEKQVSLQSVEGFIRQILGWREYVRGIYWLKMPDYEKANFFEASEKLPHFYWTAKTNMNCLHQCVTETQKNAYAHHIQRLMVLGNFALLLGVHPEYVNEWFLVVYADAYQWVELPNVTGMILFADGGYLASKPYAAGGAYINKMSNYCKNCAYDPNEKNGPRACPFNYLYWDFLARNRPKLVGNPRIEMMYKLYDKMDDQRKADIQSDALKLKQFFRNEIW